MQGEDFRPWSLSLGPCLCQGGVTPEGWALLGADRPPGGEAPTPLLWEVDSGVCPCGLSMGLGDLFRRQSPGLERLRASQPTLHCTGLARSLSCSPTREAGQ